MRRARANALDELEPLLKEVRKVLELTERSRGIFYRGSKAFLHFHEDDAGLFADLKVNDKFERFRVSTARERATFLKRTRAALR